MVYSALALDKPTQLEPALAIALDNALTPFGFQTVGIRGKELVLSVVNPHAVPADPKKMVDTLLALPDEMHIRESIDSITYT